MGNQTLTFAIPPGQLKFSRPVTEPQGSSKEKWDEGEPLADEAPPMTASVDLKMDEGEAAVKYMSNSNGPQTGAQEHQRPGEDGPVTEDIQPLIRVIHTKTEGQEEAAVGYDTDRNRHQFGAQEHERPVEDGSLAEDIQPLDGVIHTKTKRHEAIREGQTDVDRPKIGVEKPDTLDDGVSLAANVQHVASVKDIRTDIDDVVMEIENYGNSPESHTQELSTANGSFELGGVTALSNGHTNDITPSAVSNGTVNGPQIPDLEPLEAPEAVIHYEIKNLRQLMDKAIEIDGRLDPKSVPAASPWRFMRVKRNNQDLGTLFEMREEFYAYKLPKLAKRTKR